FNGFRVLGTARFLVYCQRALIQWLGFGVGAFVQMQEAEFVEQVSDVRMVRPEFLFSDLQRALSQRQAVIIVPRMDQIRRLRIESMSFMEQTIVTSCGADLCQPNLITSRGEFEFGRNLQTIWAVCFRHELRALFFLWPDLIIELRNLLAVGREQAFDDVDAALSNTHAGELAGGQIDLKPLRLAAGNLTLDEFSEFENRGLRLTLRDKI